MCFFINFNLLLVNIWSKLGSIGQIWLFFDEWPWRPMKQQMKCNLQYIFYCFSSEKQANERNWNEMKRNQFNNNLKKKIKLEFTVNLIVIVIELGILTKTEFFLAFILYLNWFFHYFICPPCTHTHDSCKWKLIFVGFDDFFPLIGNSILFFLFVHKIKVVAI